MVRRCFYGQLVGAAAILGLPLALHLPGLVLLFQGLDNREAEGQSGLLPACMLNTCFVPDVGRVGMED